MKSATKGTVLVVEDEHELVEMISEELGRQNLVCQHADNFAEAVRRVANQRYLALIVDIKIRNGTGTDLVQRIRRETFHPNHTTPIVITSGHLDKSLLENLRPLVQKAMVKPYSIQELGAWVREQIPEEKEA